MLEGFYCPDGGESKVDACLTSCRMGSRCMTLPMLVAMSQEREWNGKPSTTQLINGTMYEFHKLTKPYYVDPNSRVFMVRGTMHHNQMEDVAKLLGLPAEVALSVDRDIFDLLEMEGTEIILTDRKMWGSFKVAKALGLEEVGKKPDPKGTVYKTTTKYGKAGEPKMVPLWHKNPDKADTWEANLQLNRYRVMLKELGVNIDRLQLEVVVRDGGLYIAKDRGVDRNIYKIPIPIMPDEEVVDYFDYKEDCLLKALADREWERSCNEQESWEGNRCKGYCEVWEHCPRGRMMYELEG